MNQGIVTFSLIFILYIFRLCFVQKDAGKVLHVISFGWILRYSIWKTTFQLYNQESYFSNV